MSALTPNQMFKVGFLLRCADESLSEEATAERIQTAKRFVNHIEKQGVPKGLGGAVLTGADLAKSLVLWSLVGGGLVGGVGGYAAGALTDEPVTPEEVKKQELVAAYQQHADRVRRQLAQGRYRDTKLRKPQLAFAT